MAGTPNGTPAGGQVLRKVGDFEIISKLGQGAMGAVFKARQCMLDRIVALKVLPPTIAKDPGFIDRFVREARASAKLSHPNVVAGIDVGQDEATQLWYFAMEFIDGPTVKQMLDQQPRIPEDRALQIARDIACALDCAQQAGLIHRDVKPDNILVTEDGTAKLADLGLARQIHEDSSITMSGQALGTPYYMAPEQARGENETLDTRADLYALGATLFHMVVGQPPFTGETAAVIMAKHLTEAPPAAHQVSSDVSPGCSRLIQRLMQKEKSKRFQTPRDVVHQIERLLSVPFESRTQGPLRGTTGAQEQIRSRRSKEKEGEAAAPVKSRLPLMIGAATGAILLLIVAVVLLSGNGGQESERIARKDDPVVPVVPPVTTPVPPRSTPDQATAPLPPAQKAPAPPPVVEPIPVESLPVRPSVTEPVPEAANPFGKWYPLFEGQGSAGWAVVKEGLFASGSAGFDDRRLVFQQGEPCSGLQFLGRVPRMDYELECEAMRLSGPDSMCLIRFPVGGTAVLLVLGGFQNTIAGLDQVDGQASNGNPTTRRVSFKDGQWYRIRIGVTKTYVDVSVDDRPLIHLDHTKHHLSLREYFAPLGPLGIATWECRTAVRSVRIRWVGVAPVTPDRTPAVAETSKPEPAPDSVPKANPPPVPPPPKTEGILSEKAEAAYQALVSEVSPLLEQNRLGDAIALLERKARAPELKDSIRFIEQEKADLAAVVALREAAIQALRSMVGQTVKLTMGKRVETGKVQEESGRKGVTLNVGGPVVTIPPERLCPADVDRYAPPPAKPDDHRIRGVLYLAAGDVAKAKACFQKAQENGAKDETLQLYLDRIAVAEMGAAEAASSKAWKRAEELFAQKRLKEAEAAYLAFQEKHRATQVFKDNAETLKQRLDAIAAADKPQAVFVADESMKLYPVGFRQNEFPVQESDDATDPFRNKVIYFDQRTGKDVVYNVVSPRPLSGLRWKGAAMQNMTIEVLDPSGKVLGQGGPYEGGNHWAEFNVKFRPAREFALRFRNHVSHWYMIAELEFYRADVAPPP